MSGHLYRGYTIPGFKTSDQKTREIENYSGIKKPILFIFSGIGSQWPGMGMEISVKYIFVNIENNENNYNYNDRMYYVYYVEFLIFQVKH